MSLTPASVCRWSLIAAGIIAYPVAAYHTTATAVADRFPVLGLDVSLMPLLAILSWRVWRSPRRSAALLLYAGYTPRCVPAPPSLPVKLRWT